MRDWVPVPGTTKARLVEIALVEFARRGYEAVPVTEIATEAGVTVGSLYHHFGSKIGLYDTVRTDVERRLLDRMEGALAASGDLATALGLGLDYLVGAGFARLLAEPHPERADDPVERLLAAHAASLLTARLLAAAWREALRQDDTVGAREALMGLV